MTISLTDAGKRFNRDWIFRHLSYQFKSNNSYAIIGPNGSGKSTLLQVLSGAMQLNEGKIEFGVGPEGLLRRSSESGVDIENIFNQVAICAPYLEVIEEMTVKEFLEFHHGFKPFLTGITIDQMIETVGLQKATNKQIRYYSSGMKQRVKLVQAVFSDVPIILLDEPCTNLDAAGVSLYNQLINDHCRERLVIVSSNDPQEYQFCKERINIMDWK